MYEYKVSRVIGIGDRYFATIPEAVLREIEKVCVDGWEHYHSCMVLSCQDTAVAILHFRRPKP
jgi:hypothetical protein